ncbi:hypothetical protein 015DV002_255 [Bacillus phage 015DV002]|nr:hypothetical protein 015DV002_7 [Bacillus phage 015DV002]QQO41209.1 hypothetical protein 015DV002_255 [Bacillus phage 015DV002]
MTPNYYEWAIRHLDNATKGMNAEQTLNHLRVISRLGALDRPRLGTDKEEIRVRLFNDNMKDIFQALAANSDDELCFEVSMWYNFRAEAVCYILETVAGIMADELEEALKN